MLAGAVGRFPGGPRVAPMLRQTRLPLLVAMLSLLLGGCEREREATLADNRRFVEHADREVALTEIAIERFVRDNALQAKAMPLEAERFLEWRRREWWHLRRELAWAMTYEWSLVEKHVKDVGRYYGYNVMNFPRLREDVLRFFQRADPEWRNLVMDVTVFIEWQNRERVPLREDLKRFYAHVDWEVANLQVDVMSFVEWRNREYKLLVRDGRDFFALGAVEAEKLLADVERFRLHASIERRRLVADFREFISYERAQVPRLIDDVWRFTEWREREWNKLTADVRRWGELSRGEASRLLEDVRRFKQEKIEQIPKLLADLERFFETYEREVRPLKEEVKRFWTDNVALGAVLVADVKRFYDLREEEIGELEQDMLRFIDYGSVEWKALQNRVRRFLTNDRDPVYGDGIVPGRGDHPPGVFNDHSPPRTYDTSP